MSQALQSLLSSYNHEISNTPGGIQIKAKAPEATSQVAGYVLAGSIGAAGLFVAVVGLRKIGCAIMAVGLLIGVNTWKRSQNTNVRTALSLLIGPEEVSLSQGFRTTRIRRDEVKDIRIRQRSAEGQNEAQLFFVDANEKQYESILFYGLSASGLKESAKRIADHIWNYVKANEEDHRTISPLDLPDAMQREDGERPPWG